MRKLFVMLSVLALPFLFVSTANAANLYVSPTGNDANSGTESSPFKTIQKCNNSSKSGDTCFVQAGNYPARVTINKSGVTFQAVGNVVTQSFTIFDGDHDPAKAGIKDVKLRGFKIEQAEGAGIDIFGANILVEDNKIYNNKADGDSDGIDFFCHDCTIRGNHIYNLANSGHPDCFQTWADKWHPAPYNVTIEKNICENMKIYDADGVGRGQGIIIQSGPGTHPSGSQPHDITLRNNLFYAYKGVAISPAITAPPFNITIINNTFLGVIPRPVSNYSIQGIVCDGGNSGTVTVKNNIVYNNDQWLIGSCYKDNYNMVYRSDGTTTSGTKRANDIWGVDPLFTNTSSAKTFENFTPKNTSKACNGGEAGTYIGAMPCSTVTAPAPVPVPVQKLGDANTDTKVDNLDYNIWFNNYLKALSGAKNGDFNGNSKVDGIDYVIWLNNYGK